MPADTRPPPLRSRRPRVRPAATATARLRDSEHERERLQRIIESTGAGTFEWQLQTGELRVDARWAAILGRTLAELEPISIRLFDEHCHPEDMLLARAALRRHLAGEAAEYDCEYRVRHKQGGWAWVLARGRVTARDAQGQATWLSGTHMDITARKAAEQALRDNEALLDRAGRIAGVGGWQFDLRNGRLSFTPQALQILGMADAPPGDLRAMLELYPDGGRQQVEAALVAAIDEDRGWDMELPLHTPDGRQRWVRTIGEPQREDGVVVRLFGTLQDNSARKALELRLAEGERFLRQVTDSLPMRVAYLDRAGRYRFANRALCAALGRAHEQVIGRTRAELLGVGVDTVSAQRLDEALAGHKQRYERAEFAAGLLCTIEGQLLPDRAAEGAGGPPIQGVCAIETDISDRRRAEEQLRRSHDMLQSVLENMPCGIAVYDIDLKLVAHNAQFRAMLGLPDELFERAETLYEDLLRHQAAQGEFGPQGDVEALVAERIEQARWPMAQDHEHLRPDGRVLEMRTAPMPGGGFAATCVDVTERRQAEARRVEAEAMLRGAIDAVDEAFVLFDADDRLVFCNDKYRDLYQLSAAAIVPGTPFETLLREGVARGQYPEADGRIGDWIAERLAAHRAADASLVQRLADGTWLRIVERRMPSGHTVGFRIDITDLMNATEALEQASRAKSQFLATMSHEIRTPMNAILGMLKLLRRTSLDARQHDYAIKAEGAARSLLALLNDVLDFSKVEAGKMTLDPRPFELDALLRDLAVILAANAAGKNVELMFDIDPAVPARLVGDDLRLRQVLINLGGNALKFTPHGEVCVSVHLAACDGGVATLDFAVRDTGIGIAPENQARIFTGFTQAEASTTRLYGGTGLGLAISQRLVALMGGELALHSVPGQGSRFSFRLALPAAGSAIEGGDGAAEAGARAAAAATAAAADAPLSRLGDADAPDAPDASAPADDANAPKVLLVESHDGARAVLLAMARAQGWQVAHARDGAAAQALLAAERARGDRFDAVLLSWHLPGEDGWQLGERLRAHLPPGEGALIAMTSAQGQEHFAERAEAAAALLDGLLHKPITPAMLREALRAAQPGRDGAGAARAGLARPGAALPALPKSADASPSDAAVRSSTAGTARPLEGLRVLVVEDNANNQQIARELLEDEGAQVALAGNGREGVERVLADPAAFDVVLMDLQMPVMDGFAATAAIRREVDGTRLPIIAMTANVSDDYRRSCLAAGMNDHVGKPFEMGSLVALLQRLRVRPGGPIAAAPTESGPAPEPPGAVLPTALVPLADEARAWGIDLAGAYERYLGRTAFYLRSLRRLRASLPSQCSEIDAARDGGDREASMRAAHSLKGLAAMLGLDRLADRAAAAEERLRAAADPLADAQALDELSREADAAMHAADALAARLDALTVAA